MKFTPELVKEFLRRIAIDGRSARSVGRDDDMPSYEAFYNLMNKDEVVRSKYFLAQESRATAIDDHIDSILKDMKDKKTDWQSARLEIDTAKFRMAKFFPRLYGEQTQRIEVEHKASFIDELKKVQQAVEERKRLEARTIEGKVNEV